MRQFGSGPGPQQIQRRRRAGGHQQVVREGEWLVRSGCGRERDGRSQQFELRGRYDPQRAVLMGVHHTWCRENSGPARAVHLLARA
ncbi:hypothetical protein GCM10017771_36100 [Streptomyces capitiformicae]|uniref:Uncharacterized protein n=1 Tax=Streptomyces capitiformicae TaxID=2014920 RepID=A0A919GQE3_9ACTN|nr:hypothetical protein GCM10017771_36100 [Streptomyces capitiformicae]